MREIWFAALFALTAFAVHPAAAQPAASPPPSPPVDSAKAANLLAIKPDDRVLGKPDAPITIVEYASLSCPHCAHFESAVLPELKKKWIDTGKAKLVMRDFPLDGPALGAEVLARCAVPPDRYYPLVELIFANQEKWVIAKDWKAALEQVVRVAGIGKDKFQSCLGDKKLEDQVAQSRLTASTQLGVNATPTFFVNGKKFEGDPNVQAFDRLLSQTAAKS